MRIRYLSLFAGIGGFELGLQEAISSNSLRQCEAQCVGYSEIDPNCIAIYQTRFPHAVNVGDIRHVDFRPWRGSVDLIMAGFPCQDLSTIRGSTEGLRGSKSSLFFELLRCLQECQPRFFVIENVVMSHKNREEISQALGVNPVLFNSAPWTAQNRERLFWCNFPISMSQLTPNVTFEEQLDPKETVKHLAHSPKFLKYLANPVWSKSKQAWVPRWRSYPYIHDSANLYSRCIPRCLAHFNVLIDRRFDPPLIRKLSVAEVTRLQGFPEDWTRVPGVCATQQYFALGNAVSVPVVQFIMHSLLEIQNGSRKSL
jgi:site-specific DNA-cytosine methylase